MALLPQQLVQARYHHIVTRQVNAVVIRVVALLQQPFVQAVMPVGILFGYSLNRGLKISFERHTVGFPLHKTGAGKVYTPRYGFAKRQQVSQAAAVAEGQDMTGLLRPVVRRRFL